MPVKCILNSESWPIRFQTAAQTKWTYKQVQILLGCAVLHHLEFSTQNDYKQCDYKRKL